MGNNNSTVQHSPMKITKKKFIWTIENFSAREYKTGECLKSGIFTSFSPSGNRLKWQLSINPNGDTEEAKDYVSIYIFLIGSGASPSQVSAKAEYYIRDSKIERCKPSETSYCGQAPKMKEMAKELLAAANKFQLERLKMLCESHLVQSLENGNVCELLVLANGHSAEHLKTKAIEYIKLHGKEVKASNGWEMLTKEHLQLLV